MVIAERTSQLGADAGGEGERQRAEHRRERRHQNGAEALPRRLHRRVMHGEAALALGVQREIDEHDAVLLDDADQQKNADEGDDGEFRAEQPPATAARRAPPRAASR